MSWRRFELLYTTALTRRLSNQDKSADIFCRQVAARVPVVLPNVYLLRNYKIANSSTTTEGSEKADKSDL
jgi:hypothetical protein